MEDNTQNTQQAQTQTQNNEQSQTVDYGKIEAMINKGVQQKESAILKSYFEQQGMTEDEIKSAVSSYKAEQAKKAEDSKNAYANMQAENEQLKAQILDGKISTRAAQLAKELGFADNSISYALKLADIDKKKVINDKGELSDDIIKAALEQVGKDVPALKVKDEDGRGFKVGGGTGGNQTDDATQDELYKLFGVKRK